MPISPELSKKLLELKEQSGLTFEQIGAEVGTSDANARRYIKGETKIPEKKLLIAIIRCLGGDPDELLQNTQQLPQQTTGIYEKMKAEYDSQLSMWHTRHDKEIENLRHASDLALQNQEEWIRKLKAELDELRKTNRKLIVATVVLAALLLVFISVYLARDLMDPTWGHFVW